MKIRVDYRERDSELLSLLKELDWSLEIASIPYGDYIINEEITIERKT
ncbi:MAG: heavy metal resistance protein CzcA, partial [Deltaproteobacteria bacterium]|nr:heavy metal resistance protein CzcA [Deltaproteobacteria bacterium]